MNYILRRRKLGHGSTRGIVAESQTGLSVYRNDRGLPITGPTDYVFRWGCTSNVPGSPTIINRASAIHWVTDKATSRMLLADEGLSPKSSTTNWCGDADYFPVILRRRNHAQGRNLHFCRNYDEFLAASELYGEGNYYVSEFIDKVAEYRVCVVSGRVAWVARKTPADAEAVAWNVAQGGRFDNVRWSDWPMQAIDISLKAFTLSGLDFGGVDVMIDREGRPYVLEINSAMSLTSPYRIACVAKTFDYIVRNGREMISTMVDRGYESVIHPALLGGRE